MFEEVQVREHIRRGFYDLYSTDLEKPCLNSPISSFSCRLYKAGLWALKAFKALSSDGLHAEFFQHF